VRIKGFKSPGTLSKANKKIQRKKKFKQHSTFFSGAKGTKKQKAHLLEKPLQINSILSKQKVVYPCG